MKYLFTFNNSNGNYETKVENYDSDTEAMFMAMSGFDPDEASEIADEYYGEGWDDKTLAKNEKLNQILEDFSQKNDDAELYDAYINVANMSNTAVLYAQDNNFG